ncbi:MAG: hypothetical protein IKX19_07290, partial [Clostridia bacterium]|nr:hypothetical protein [Clostridia bacterium]
MENTTTPKKKTRSIAKELNAALAWRAFLRGLGVSVLVCAVLLVGWCCAREGGFSANTERSFMGKLNFAASPRAFAKAAAELPVDAVRLVKRLIL